MKPVGTRVRPHAASPISTMNTNGTQNSHGRVASSFLFSLMMTSRFIATLSSVALVCALDFLSK